MQDIHPESMPPLICVGHHYQHCKSGHNFLIQKKTIPVYERTTIKRQSTEVCADFAMRVERSDESAASESTFNASNRSRVPCRAFYEDVKIYR